MRAVAGNAATRKRLTGRRFENVADNAWLSLTLAKPLPAGTYYLEASEPNGRIGWWSHTEDVYADGQAFADRAPIPGDRTLQIVTVGGQQPGFSGYANAKTTGIVTTRFSVTGKVVAIP